MKFSTLSFIILIGTVLVGCSGLDLAKTVIGAGDIVPDVAQVGKNNSIGVTETTEVVVKDVVGDVRPVVRPEGIVTAAPTETITQTNYNYSPWMIFALIIWSIFLWQLPSPDELSRRISSRWQKWFGNK